MSIDENRLPVGLYHVCAVYIPTMRYFDSLLQVRPPASTLAELRQSIGMIFYKEGIIPEATPSYITNITILSLTRIGGTSD